MSSDDPAAWRVTRKTVRFGPFGLYIDDTCLALQVDGKYVSPFTQSESLKKILELLDEGRTADAILLANFASFSLDARQLTRANFNPDEARDARARWTQEPDGISSPTVEQVQYRGHFHNLVVDDLIRGLNAHGANAIAHVEVSGIAVWLLFRTEPPCHRAGRSLTLLKSRRAMTRVSQQTRDKCIP